ncbi:AbrB/MazE/SpoVT family DNA-binding domain-containing protein [Siminovitchia sp. 179-K 8D1 HS]|uniref:AbrB/MazE/SpoVT family DNA-binding domain-containing protein n=1 Tax=Siminovitchia sp. 179-K 8D1 HS TaxID=3142385 RepID=UPI0039A272EC
MYLIMSKNGQIRIPKKIQKQLNLIEGQYLFVYESKNCIMIEKHHEDETLNQCLFTNGKITIPMELRRLCNINVREMFSIEVSCNKIILKKRN